jgi:hypothetical protein
MLFFSLSRVLYGAKQNHEDCVRFVLGTAYTHGTDEKNYSEPARCNDIPPPTASP